MRALGGALATFVTGAVLAATAAPALASPVVVRTHSPASGVIRHVVFIVQENRSFNNLFMNYPGAYTRPYGLGLNGEPIPLHPQSLAQTWDIDHSSAAFMSAYNGGALNGWNDEIACCGNIPSNAAYAYVPENQIETYWNMARQYVLADRMFQSNLDGSYIAHQYVIAAYADHEVNYPNLAWGCYGIQQDIIATLNQNRTLGGTVPVCEDYQTLGDELDGALMRWRYYTSSIDSSGGPWSAYSAIDHIFNGPDWSKDVIDPQARFITDVGNDKLAAVTWITPTPLESDHAGSNSLSGPRWIAQLVDAVGESKFWDSTAIFLIWDDWGGWYDPVPPVYEDFDGLGFRIPMIMINAYAQPGIVTHRRYETSSVLRFIEDLFGLAPLAASDARANDPAYDGVFDFNAPPRKFHHFPVPPPVPNAPHVPFFSAGGD